MFNPQSPRPGDLVRVDPLRVTWLLVDGIASDPPLSSGEVLVVLDVAPDPQSYDPHRRWLRVLTPAGVQGEVLADAVLLVRRTKG